MVTATTSDPLTYTAQGTFIITWIYDDGNGNTSSQTQTVVVIDTQLPQIICPADITQLNDPGKCQAYVNIAVPPTSDNCGVLLVINSFNNGPDATGVYPVGTTTVLWTVTDIHGLTSTCSMQITVVDSELPVITCPASITVSANNINCQADVTIPESVSSDNCGIASITNNYTNTANASGTYPAGVTSVEYIVTDIHGNIATCSFMVIVTAAPIAADDYSSTPVNTPVDINMLVNDTDCDNNLNPQAVTVLAPAQHGIVIIDPITGIATYTPYQDYNGNDSYDYQVCDIDGNCTIAKVHITIGSEILNNPPVAVNDTVMTLINIQSIIPVLANDSDPDNNQLIVSICGQPSHGSIILNEDQTFSYFPATDYTGTDEFCYSICDNGTPSLCSTAKVIITIVPDEQRPVLIIYNTFTPNGDTKNDTWWIEGIESYRDNEVTIFNRWGDEVWHAENYDNQLVVWDGSNKNGEKLPDATYFYIIKLRSINETFSGWVMIHK
jgi:gliding motility-associated-like protein